MIFFNFIKYLISNIRYTRLIKKVYKDEDLINKFSKLFGVEFRIDWVGRLYAVLNPNITEDKLDLTTQFFEYDENGLNNKLYLERWIMTKFNLVKDFILANNLFDLLTYTIEKIDEYDNYLFIIKPITFDDFVKNTKRFLTIYGIFAVILIGLIILL